MSRFSAQVSGVRVRRSGDREHARHYELVLGKRRTRVSGTFTDESTAMFYSTERMDLDHRASDTMLRDEEERCAPSLLGIDLRRRTVVLRPNPPKDE
ncbi:DUF6191 domain-containing protein [Nocardia vulneris]|uniref:DUF6191 domain-containing protein n=1 Tax=Nocardia vulneris TaxID=1141657 RepID=UPI0007A3CE46|nr:DUF6191 domain-containing protein [Nocardia vulneris]